MQPAFAVAVFVSGKEGGNDEVAGEAGERELLFGEVEPLAEFVVRQPVAGGEDLSITLHDSNAPGTLASPGSTDFLTVLMPMRV